ncbi:hypothetical protein I41_08340 [Lacipirellula limnantheis]|uniref:Uncharacterized protein n=1 Tax=Lacipirellula limnantheis TaxID=2528024 RepID=A0A517TTH9_9BACT|nr:hypothetical protein I41_08340 [Lacipirellula limnantheis]
MAYENILTVGHQDGLQSLRLTKGGYCCEDNRLAISIETENTNDDGWPPVALFCIYNHPLDRDPCAGDVFECNGGMFAEDADDADVTHAAAYFTFHAEEVYVQFTVIEVRQDTLVVDFRAKHDDTAYYDAQAKECPTSGTFVLSRQPLKNLWIPL